MGKINAYEIPLVEKHPLFLVHDKVMLAQAGNVEGVLAYESKLVLIVCGVGGPPYLEGDFHSPVGVNMPAVNKASVYETIVRMEDVYRVVPVIQMLPRDSFVAKPMGIWKYKNERGSGFVA